MSIRLNDTAPDFRAETTKGPINFHEWIGGDEGRAIIQNNDCAASNG